MTKSRKKTTIWKNAKILIGITLTALVSSYILLNKTKPDCYASHGQTVVKWKDMYWFPCKQSWNGFCLWPIRRKHSTYKVTVTEGIPVRDENGEVMPIANGKRMKWAVYDSTNWNALENFPARRNRFKGYEPIADNEFVVIVETRYVLFHNVEATLRLCTQP